MEQDQEALKNHKRSIEILANKVLTQAQAATVINEETSRKMSNRPGHSISQRLPILGSCYSKKSNQ
jgi:hypothetical protein